MFYFICFWRTHIIFQLKDFVSPIIDDEHGKFGFTTHQSKASALWSYTWLTFIWHYCSPEIHVHGKLFSLTALNSNICK